jgi:hypothetical protein
LALDQTTTVRYSPCSPGTSPPLDERPGKIAGGFLRKYRLYDFPSTICEEPD